VETDVVECFRNGGGVSYDRYPRFAQIMRSDSAAVFDAFLIDTVLPLAPGLPEQLRAGVDVADVGCGAGHAINLMAREYPKSRFTGFDFSSEAIAIAKGEAREWGLTNASFEVQDVAALDVADGFDVVTAFDAIHDQAHPRWVLAAVHRALKPGGTFLMCDTTGSSHVERNMELPLGPFMYTVSYLHCMAVSLAYDGEGLGTVWGEELARDLLREAGFGSVEVNRVEGDLFNNYYLAKKVAKT
jgi:ubiquinone/menaquinone biosynthesis C-methylase UbiE